ncbi:MAG TPA: biopolymer transporter ExbD [Xanthomonadaceae bacterium]|nr:biopolymer transporter ExbD [Xanthomonadaceae bacterium]
MPSTQHSVAQINITPLVDVMLVLLVIFMIAAPVVSQPIRLDLPGTSPPPPVKADAPIVLRIDAAGQVYWNGDATPLPTLRAMLQAEVARDAQAPITLQIDASDDADYGVVARVLAAACHAEVQRIGFLRR